VSPLFKYLITGGDAARFVDRIITRDVSKMAVGQVYYTPWCDEHGKVIDDGTVSRLEDQKFRWTAADPSLRWLTQNAAGMEVRIDDISEDVAALALQGPTAARLLGAVAKADIASLKYFRVTSGTIGGVKVDISRTGYTGDLGYEIWMRSTDAVRVWDALMRGGKPFDIKPAGMLALDVARIEAGLLLIDVDFFSSKKAMIEPQKYSPYEMGLGRLVSLNKARFIGQPALRRENARGHARQIVGLEVDWPEVEAIYEKLALAPSIGATASRVSRRTPGRTRDIHHLVADAEEADRARDSRRPALRRGYAVAVRDHRRSGPVQGESHGGQNTILRSEAEDGTPVKLRLRRSRQGFSGVNCPTSNSQLPDSVWPLGVGSWKLMFQRSAILPSCTARIMRSNAYSRSSRFEYGPGV
jgi:glycine cleavage system aminomethyltransferase T